MKDNKQLASKIKLSQRSGSLILSGCNLFKIPTKVWNLTDIIRLDLSFNNIDALPSLVSGLGKLRDLTLNDNPLRMIPAELSKCSHLQTLDLSRTRIQVLPRDLAIIPSLLELNLERCPLKPSLQAVYDRGIIELWAHLKRKHDRRLYKEKVFGTLKESIYPGEDVRAIMELTLSTFANFKDLDTEVLKLFVHNLKRIFPEKMAYASPIKIREALNKIVEDLAKRAEISKITLNLVTRYPESDIDVVSRLATSISQTLSKGEIKTIFREKLLPQELDGVDIDEINDSLNSYKEKQDVEIGKCKLNLSAKLKGVYQDHFDFEDIERLVEELTDQLKSPIRIRQFIQTADNFLPRDLKESNAQTIKQNFMSTILNNIN